jgi:hypothetical protein
MFFSKAKDAMFAATHTERSPWYVVESNDKKRARLNCISHLLSVIPFSNLPYTPVELPPKQELDYERPPKGTNEILVPEKF